jgi:hypothetical protein
MRSVTKPALSGSAAGWEWVRMSVEGVCRVEADYTTRLRTPGPQLRLAPAGRIAAGGSSQLNAQFVTKLVPLWSRRPRVDHPEDLPDAADEEPLVLDLDPDSG